MKTKNIPISEMRSLLKELKQETVENRKDMKMRVKHEDYAQAHHIYSVNQALEYVMDMIETLIRRS